MSYRRSKATTERIRRQIEAMRRGKERAAMARATRAKPPPGGAIADRLVG